MGIHTRASNTGPYSDLMAKQPNKKRPNKKSTKQPNKEYNDWRNFRRRMQKETSKKTEIIERWARCTDPEEPWTSFIISPPQCSAKFKEWAQPQESLKDVDEKREDEQVNSKEYHLNNDFKFHSDTTSSAGGEDEKELIRIIEMSIMHDNLVYKSNQVERDI